MITLPAQTEIFTTADGSPTLSFRRADGYAEKMHHSAGALSESLYIYHQALLEGVKFGPPRVVSVGLGLGYNEIISAAEFLTTSLSDFTIWSFEAQPELREGFRNWLQGDQEGVLAEIFTDVLGRVARTFTLSNDELFGFLQTALSSGKLQLRGAFPDDSAGVLATVVYYDAYSRKMNSELWDEDSVVASLEPILLPNAVLATYAATGSLNRALKRLGFRPIDKAGFQGKRESTLAIRAGIL